MNSSISSSSPAPPLYNEGLTFKESETLRKLLKKRLRLSSATSTSSITQSPAPSPSPSSSSSYDSHKIQAYFRPTPITGSEFISLIQQTMKGTKTHSDFLLIAQQQLDYGAIEPIEPPKIDANSEQQQQQQFVFSEKKSYIPIALKELKSKQAKLLLMCLRDENVLGERKIKTGTLKGCFSGSAAIDCWFKSLKFFVFSRQIGLGFGQELLNKGFIEPLPGGKPEFRDSKDCFYALRAEPFKFWGYMLKRNAPNGIWKIFWFLCKNQRERLLYCSKTPQDSKFLEFIDFDDSDVRICKDVELAFEIVMPNSIICLQTCNFELMNSWINIIRPLAFDILQDNLSIERAELTISNSEINFNKKKLSQSQQKTKNIPTPTSRLSAIDSSLLFPSPHDDCDDDEDGDSEANMSISIGNGNNNNHNNNNSYEQFQEDEKPPRAPSEGISISRAISIQKIIPLKISKQPQQSEEQQVFEMEKFEESFERLICAKFSGQATSLLITQRKVWIGTSTGDIFVANIPSSSNNSKKEIETIELQPVAVPSVHWASVNSLIEVGGNQQPISVWSGDEHGEITIWESVTCSAFRTFTQRNENLPVIMSSGRPSGGKVICAGSNPGTIEIWQTDNTGLEAQQQEIISIYGCTSQIQAISITSHGNIAYISAGIEIYSLNLQQQQQQQQQQQPNFQNSSLECNNNNNSTVTVLQKYIISDLQQQLSNFKCLYCLNKTELATATQLWCGHLNGEISFIDVGSDNAQIRIWKQENALTVNSFAILNNGTILTLGLDPNLKLQQKQEQRDTYKDDDSISSSVPCNISVVRKQQVLESAIFEWSIESMNSDNPKRIFATTENRLSLICSSDDNNLIALSSPSGKMLLFKKQSK